MGKGDKKTRRGKITNRSYGVRRRKKNKPSKPVSILPKKEKPEREPVKKTSPGAGNQPEKETKPKVQPKEPAGKTLQEKVITESEGVTETKEKPAKTEKTEKTKKTGTIPKTEPKSDEKPEKKSAERGNE
jgi:30S ribosomal protein S31